MIVYRRWYYSGTYERISFCIGDDITVMLMDVYNFV